MTQRVYPQMTSYGMYPTESGNMMDRRWAQPSQNKKKKKSIPRRVRALMCNFLTIVRSRLYIFFFNMKTNCLGISLIPSFTSKSLYIHIQGTTSVQSIRVLERDERKEEEEFNVEALPFSTAPTIPPTHPPHTRTRRKGTTTSATLQSRRHRR